MSVGFQAVQWNGYKRLYDVVAVVVIAAYLASFLYLSPLIFPSATGVTPEILQLRAFGSAAFLMLTAILCIGPLARLDARFLPLLYNRRHLGVMTGLLALVHAWLVLDWYHGHGAVDPVVSVLSSNSDYGSFPDFPFELPGILALVILSIMAATSHDFWLAFLRPPVWKAIHMAVYGAWFLLVAHVALGVMQSEKSLLWPGTLAAGAVLLIGLHGMAARQEQRRAIAVPDNGWLIVGPPGSILDGRATKIVPPSGERIAVFRDGTRLSALSDVCAHQNGPLSEGRIVAGCVTCPWHGFQYRMEDGCAPPPFTEKLPTYRLRLKDGLVELDPIPLPPGTPIPPLDIAAWVL